MQRVILSDVFLREQRKDGSYGTRHVKLGNARSSLVLTGRQKSRYSQTCAHSSYDFILAIILPLHRSPLSATTFTCIIRDLRLEASSAFTSTIHLYDIRGSTPSYNVPSRHLPQKPFPIQPPLLRAMAPSTFASAAAGNNPPSASRPESNSEW